jgi:hypothetical protein
MGVSGKKLSDSDVREVWRLRLLGWSVRDVGREMGIHYLTVWKYAPQWRVDKPDGLVSMLKAIEAHKQLLATKRKNRRSAR